MAEFSGKTAYFRPTRGRAFSAAQRQVGLGVLVMLGLGMIVFLVWSLLYKPNEIFSTEGFHTFLLPIFLSFWMLPLGLWTFSLCRLRNFVHQTEIGEISDRLAGARLRWPKDHDEVDSMFASLAETLKDPVLDEPGDFVWSGGISLSEKPRFKAMADYMVAIAPLISECAKHDAQAQSWIAEYFTGELSVGRLRAKCKERFGEVQSLSEVATGLPDCFGRIRRVDAPFQSYVSSVDILYHYIVTSFVSEERREAGDARLQYFSEECDKDWEKLRATIERFCPQEAELTSGFSSI